MILEQLITSFIASAAFSILFNVPKKTLLPCGFVGMLGWLLYVLLQEVPVNPILASLAASFFVTVVSQLLAKLFKTPIIVFSVSGVIPLVPGGAAYDAMRNVVQNQYDLAVQLGAKAFMISGAIAIGLVFSEVINQAIRRSRL
ncbi:threonine/serine exporter family protein [Paenibacillus filicis]|uniref:Threonine/serine exporter family protein n=1 Tax=Paenibacillus gyeongsangnamensis TaxID=3388067 RepID=A0ABT4Q8Q5_9BACL|nr:threonine/serine exporter family protein [Paenibacillus filicis]MCZ8513255.1 threonine/serine exporter family protein [Paenibacillus filicis]